MIDSSDLRHIIVVFIVIAMLIIQGLRMLGLGSKVCWQVPARPDLTRT